MAQTASSPRREILGVSTNVITGFLGAGKSTAILHLLRHKPADERWAVLVNEFGEVGVDGSILGGDRDGTNVFVREVAGGCMCCAAGVPMQIALTSLLSVARPDRLLIEPTGLGHPREVLDVLSAEHYREVLDLRATVTLVDAAKVRDPDYAEHPTFLQQLAVADVIVANKADRYEDNDLQQLRGFLARSDVLRDKRLHQVEHGAIELGWLAGRAGARNQRRHDHASSNSAEPPRAPTLPECGYLRIDNAGEGFFSQGWMFDPHWRFDEARLDAALIGVEVERLKAVFLTTTGVLAYNFADGTMTKNAIDDALDSRVELISRDRDAFSGVQDALLQCVASRGDGAAGD